MQFYGEEQRDYDMFIGRHSCPDLEHHHREKLTFSVSYGNGGGIGSNTYVCCDRCNCKQDITDYGIW